jgi:hypothetical protein
MDLERDFDPLLPPAECRLRAGNISEPTWRRHWRPYLPVVQLSPRRIAVPESALVALIEARKVAGLRAA